MVSVESSKIDVLLSVTWGIIGPRNRMAMGHDIDIILETTQQTRNISMTFVQRRPNVEDVGPALYKCHTNVLRLLGNHS